MALLRETVQVCGVVGNPVEHSLSPVMQSAALEALGIPWEYRALLATDDAAAVLLFEEVRSGVFAGLNVTMPYKQLAFSMCDSVSSTATVVRSVNTLRVRDGELYGDSTDGAGVVGSLARDAGLAIRDACICVLGTGATAAAAAWALGVAGAHKVTLVSREVGKAAVLARELAEHLDRYEGDGDFPGGESTRYEAFDYSAPAESFAAFDAIINATSLGMKEEDPSPLRAECFAPGQVVLDVVYGMAWETGFLRLAREAGARAFDGRGMLVEQGALSLAIWTGLDDSEIPRDVMRAAVDRALA